MTHSHNINQETNESKRPLISVIILNYNTRQLTVDCIESIKKYTPNGISVEYIIVDNASSNQEGIWLEKHYEDKLDCKVIQSHINLGFGAGNVLGSQQATGQYFAFINSDVVFIEDCFTDMVDYMSTNPKTGVCGIQILNGDREETISHRPFEGIRYKFFGKNFLYKTDSKIPKIHEKLSTPTTVDFVIGCFMFFDEKAYRMCGGFDPNIFLYYEEFDICYRLKKQGYKTTFIPHLNYIHLEGQSGEFNVDMKKEHLLSYLYVLRKNFSYSKFWSIKTYLLISYFFKSIVKSKYRPMFKFLLFRGESLAHSIRHRQTQMKNLK